MQILEINKAGIGISVSKGFLVVSEGDVCVKTQLDDLECVIINSYGAQLSNQLLISLG